MDDIQPPSGIDRFLLERVCLEINIRPRSSDQSYKDSWVSQDQPEEVHPRIVETAMASGTAPESLASPLLFDFKSWHDVDLGDHDDVLLLNGSSPLLKPQDDFTSVTSDSFGSVTIIEDWFHKQNPHGPTQSRLICEEYDRKDGFDDDAEDATEKERENHCGQNYDGLDDEYVEKDEECDEDDKRIENDVLPSTSQGILSVIEAAIRLAIMHRSSRKIAKLRVTDDVAFTSLAEIAPSIWVPGFMQVNLELVLPQT